VLVVVSALMKYQYFLVYEIKLSCSTSINCFD